MATSRAQYSSASSLTCSSSAPNGWLASGLLENMSRLLRVVVGEASAFGGGVILETDRLRATIWCDFLVCDNARFGIAGASASLDPLDSRHELI